MTLNRRRILQAAGAALLAPHAVGKILAAPQGPTKKILFFTKSSGFQHSVITRKGDQLSLAERVLIDLGRSHGFDVVASKDGRMFEPDTISQFDAFAFMTTGDLTAQEDPQKTLAKEGKGAHPMSPRGKQALLDAIESGKGFVGMHCATDTFHSKGSEVDPYIEMIGGEFSGHGKQQEALIRIADPGFPGVSAYGTESYRLNDEWYGQRNLGDDLHVILIQDTEGMEGKDYERPPYPMTWTRQQGKGRVFYTSMGHREDVWESPKYQGLLIAALNFATGRIDASTEPNVSKVTPGYQQVPKK
jgi:hypothetical protein